jgi:hypothetical protein
MGRAEAMKAVISLTGEAYSDFAVEFGQAMQSSITAEAQAVQQQSYESKVARLTAATDALKIQLGGDINAIQGFFVDMGTGFLTHVALPIMSSPVGGVISEIGAVVGIGAQGLLTFGGGVLTAASQLSVLAANIHNAGGYLQMFRGVLSVMGAPLGLLKTALAAPLGGLKTLALSFWSVAGGIWAAIAPALPFIAIGLAVAYLAYHIISSWDPTKGFFENIWNGIVHAFSAAWEKVKAIWGWIKGLFTGGSDELAVTGALTGTSTTAPPSAGVEMPDPATFGGGLTEQLAGLTNNLIPQTQTALNGLTATVDTTAILPDTTAVMPDMTPMPLDTGPLGDSVSTRNDLVSEHLAAAGRKGIAGTDITYTASSAFDDAGATATITPTVDMTELNKQAQANPYLDSLAGATATITPTMDMTEWDKQVSMTFPDAMPTQQKPFDVPVRVEAPAEKATTRSITVQNVNINVDELYTMYRFFQQIEHAVLQPQEVMV